MALHQLILAGGSGTRFWPLSRKRRPKQLLALDGGEPLVVRAARRLEGLVAPERRWVVTTAEQLVPVRQALQGLVAPERFICEPCGRDTAAALGLGAARVAAVDPAAVLVITPADHVIEPPSRLRAAVETAGRLVAAHPDAAVTFGIPPSYPATAYGYIERGAPLRPPGVGRGGPAHRCYRVARFREKPDRATAERLLAAGGVYWNAGIFCWRAAALLEALARALPEHARAVELEGAALAERYAALRRISIDHGVLEQHPEVLVIEADFAWSDVGSWTAVADLAGRDAEGNAVLGARHVGLDSRGCIIVGEPRGPLLATVGLEDVVIVQTAEATLVCARERVEEVKRLVAELERRGLEEVL
ncbi:MAG: mannose-1-phosphate guanylyltransferase [Planctomycetota bacterium]|nr:MAG: mannose-1-phosphate guanylyltransferase [Planctomycetota bacterium]